MKMKQENGTELPPRDRLVPKLLLSYDEAAWSLKACVSGRCGTWFPRGNWLL